MVKAIERWGKRGRPYPLACFSLKIWKKNVHIINNDGEHAMKLKIEFPHCNCLPEITKLIVGSHNMLLNPEQIL